MTNYICAVVAVLLRKFQQLNIPRTALSAFLFRSGRGPNKYDAHKPALEYLSVTGLHTRE